jgi:hypothetical protein
MGYFGYFMRQARSIGFIWHQLIFEISHLPINLLSNPFILDKLG